MSADDDVTKAEEEDGSQKNGAVQGMAAVEEASVVQPSKQDAPNAEPPQADEFGLPIRPPRRREWAGEEGNEHGAVNGATTEEAQTEGVEGRGEKTAEQTTNNGTTTEASKQDRQEEDENQRPRAATLDDIADREPRDRDSVRSKRSSRDSTAHARNKSMSVSEWSHQVLAPREEKEDDIDEEDEWQEMPAFATHRVYDDWGKVLAKEYDEMEDDEQVGYSSLGGAGKGYTRVQIDEDAQSATSMDDNTAYLFKEPHASNVLDEDEEGRDVVSQMQATKEFLTEGQRIAYVGVVRLSIAKILLALSQVEYTKTTRKQIDFAIEATKMWGQKMMVRLYSHMEIDPAEQIMVEQLGEHGVLPSDLTPALMQNSRVKNPAQVASGGTSARPSVSSPRPSTSAEKRKSAQNGLEESTTAKTETTRPSADEELPAYEQHTAEELTIQNPEDIENTKDLDVDLRWTVLCDLFLLLIADSSYDARSRTLLEHVGESLSISWQEVCRFEKRVTDALEMQEQADKENWNEEEHLEERRKAARKKRLMVMGLCTAGGGLVIGLSAGLLAPMIGAGLAAGFGLIGVSGTSTFLGGAGAAAMIGGGGALTGGIIGVRASDRRTGAVKTFEYRPLFNNKRPNLIVTVSGWMTGKVDDVRLPFSTIDPIMGDIYSVNWEPEMLQSTGQTIQILATEALTQTIQQVLGATILTTLMAGLSLPIVLTKLSYLIDNPWTVSLARADATGLILADSLIDRNLGVRPITLVGFSLGSRVIFSCLKELARRGAQGLVQNAYLFGSPIIAKKDEYIRARTVVAGRFVNGYATNDWILGYLFRATSGGIMRVSGLNSVDVAGIENKDVTEIVPGHMAYRGMMPTLLEEVGWLVEGLEFTEIEDPDPENHEKYQRELINEIEAARQELDDKQKEKEKKGGFKAFFSRVKKAPQKREWETYDERSQKVLEGDDKEAERLAEESKDVMFDVDAIRQEALKLALQGGDVEDIKRHLQIREIESTMPALKVTTPGTSSEATPPNGSALRQTKSSSELPIANGNVTPESAPERIEPSESTPTPAETPQRPSTATPHPLQEQSSNKPERPPLRSVATAPPPEVKSSDHNPWSDEEEFGTEKEVEMSFE